MTDHHHIRALLALQVAGSLSREEQAGVDEHLQVCDLCRSELASLSAIAAGLKSIPQPQPSFGLAQRTRARIKAEMAAKAEREQHQRYIAWAIGFAWIASALTFAAFRFMVADVAVWLRISTATSMTIFVSYMVLSGAVSIAFAGLLATHYRKERRLI